MEGLKYLYQIRYGMEEFLPVVDVINFFGGNLDSQKVRNQKKFVLMSEPSLKC